MDFYAVRGAITVEVDQPQEIYQKTKALMSEILRRNSLDPKALVSILFTSTKDLITAYPAVAVREMGLTNVPLMCCQEMDVEGSLSSCIRVLIHIKKVGEFEPCHVYLEKAVILRPDLATSPCAHKPLNIAIDGPAGAGKSTIAKRISKHLGILYLDTGSMYRAVALRMLNAGVNPSNPEEVLPLLPDTDIRVVYQGGLQTVLLSGEDITAKIRTPEVSSGASAVATIPAVRLKLVELQRQIAKEHDLVMDGRDIGTYVLPFAHVKFFLTADIKERARRRHAELTAAGSSQKYCDILKEMAARDQNDSGRSFAPLKQAEDAILLDTTEKTIDEVVEEILHTIKSFPKGE